MVGARFVMNLPKHLFMIAGTALSNLVTIMDGVALSVGHQEAAKEEETYLLQDSPCCEQS